MLFSLTSNLKEISISMEEMLLDTISSQGFVDFHCARSIHSFLLLVLLLFYRVLNNYLAKYLSLKWRVYVSKEEIYSKNYCPKWDGKMNDLL